jgi:hypothetical protein
MFLLFRKASVSFKVNGSSLILRVIRLCNPPRLRITFLIIQDADEPQIITFKLGCVEAQSFQK